MTTSGGGVTFSVGKTPAKPESLMALLEACQQAGFHTAVDTWCIVPWPITGSRGRPVPTYTSITQRGSCPSKTFPALQHLESVQHCDVCLPWERPCASGYPSFPTNLVHRNHPDRDPGLFCHPPPKAPRGGPIALPQFGSHKYDVLERKTS
jgi:hypothetical protein